MWEDYYRKQANQRRAELQLVLHRSSALCTLAHALLFDQAANDPVLQVGIPWYCLDHVICAGRFIAYRHLLPSCCRMVSATHRHAKNCQADPGLHAGRH